MMVSPAPGLQTAVLDMLLNSPRHSYQGAHINCVDEMGRSPL